MELKECLEMIYVACTNYDKDITGKLGIEREYKGSYEQAYDTVLEELNNSISKDKIENKIKELKEKLENVKNKEDRIRNGIAVIALEYCIDSINELLNK